MSATGAIFHPVNNYVWDTNLLAWIPEVSSAGGGGGAVSFSAGASSAALASVVFSNSNGVSFGLNGSTITASVSPAAGDGANIIAAGTQTANTTGTVLFQNSNGITFGMSNSSVVTASHNGLTSQSNQAFSAAGGSSAFQTLIFNNANGVSFSNNGGSIEASIASSLTNIRISAGTTSNLLSALTFANGNGISFGLNASTLTASHDGLTSQSNQAVSGSNGSFTFQTVTFGNLNGFSFYTSNGSLVGSYTVPTQSNQTIGLYASSNTTAQSSSTTIDARSFSVRGMGVASVGYSAGELIISVPSGGGAGDGVNIIAAGTQTAATTGTVLFQNSNGITFGMSNSSVVTASHNGITSQSNQDITFYATGNTVLSSSGVINASSIRIRGEGAVSIGVSNGSILVSTPLQSNVALSGSNGSFTYLTATFGNLNNFSFYTSNGSLVGSYTVPGTLSVFAQSNTTQSSSGTIPFNSLQFAGAGIASVGVSNGSVIISVPSGGGAGDGGVFAGVSNLGNTAGSTGTVSTGNFVLVGGSNITLSQSTGAAGSAATVTINGPNQTTLSGFNSGMLAAEWLAGQIGNATMQVQPFQLHAPMQFESIALPGLYTATSNQSGSATLSLFFGIYTKNVSTLSLLQSTSSSFAVTNSGTVGSYSLYSGIRHYPVAWTSTLPAGNYWLGILSRTTTGGAAGMTWSNYIGSQPSTAVLGRWSAASNATAQFMLGLGLYSASTSGVPGSIAFTQINGAANGNLRAVLYQFVSGSV